MVTFTDRMVYLGMFWFGLRLYVPVNNFSVMSGRIFGDVNGIVTELMTSNKNIKNTGGR